MKWLKAPSDLSLGSSDVHVWQVNLDAIAIDPTILSIDEQSRADRFKFEQHRQRFVAGRGFLRSLLARYLNTDPSALEFSYGSHGKPFLKHFPIQFNLAHSQHLAVYAIALDRAVGIDVEQVRAVDHLNQLVQRFFQPSEAKMIQAQPELFFQYWTCKEAFLKATGTGLSKLQELEIHNLELKTIPVEARSRNWHLRELTIDQQFASAIVIEQNGSQLNLECYVN